MNISALKVFRIDIDGNRLDEVPDRELDQESSRYFEELLTSVIDRNHGRQFQFERDTTEVRSLITKHEDEASFSEVAKCIAQRLLAKEIEAQAGIVQLNQEIQKGIVVISKVRNDDSEYFAICKADHSPFIEEESFRLKNGLPIKKKVYKAFMCRVDGQVVDNVIVYDTNASLYWWSKFLELAQVRTDEKNTEDAWQGIDRKVLSKIKDKSPRDWFVLRNSSIQYFRSHDNFDLEDFIATAIGNFVPEDGALIIQDIKNRIRELPQKGGGFDTQFQIVKSKVRARFVSIIELSDQIELKLKDDIPEEDSTITTYSKNGEKFVVIRSDRGYEYFQNRRRIQRTR